MANTEVPALIRLSETDLTLQSPHQDLRDRRIVDKNGDEVGDVRDLLLDQDHHEVRFLLVSSGGFLGIGEDTILVPVDAITEIAPDRVHVDLDRQHVAQGPTYDPTLVRQHDYWNRAYDYYGFLPFWAPGYRAPAWPGMP